MLQAVEAVAAPKTRLSQLTASNELRQPKTVRAHNLLDSAARNSIGHAKVRVPSQLEESHDYLSLRGLVRFEPDRTNQQT